MRAPNTAHILGRTYDRRLTAFRPQRDGGEVAVWVDVPCALSRTAQTSAPTPPGGGALVESGYPMALYTPPDTPLRLGDRLVIAGETLIHATASDSFCYPSHCVTVVRVEEIMVRAPAANQRSVCGGEDEVSHEACPEGGSA